MKKIAIIGNSHAGMLNQAWKVIKRNFPSVSIDFFIWRSTGNNPLRIKNKSAEIVIDEIKIIENQPNLLNLEDFDVVVICGLGYELDSVLNIYRNHRIFGQEESLYILSDQCFKEAFRGAISQTIAMKVVDALFSLSSVGTKNFIIPTPRKSEYIVDESEAFNLYKLCLENGDEESISATFESSAEFFQEKGVTVISQPYCTVAHRILTKDIYSNASDFQKNSEHIRLKGRRDLSHMNAEYGEIVLKKIFNKGVV